MYNTKTRSYNGKKISTRELYKYYTNETEILDRIKLSEKLQQHIVDQIHYNMAKKENKRQCDVCTMM
jgi:hypothetical protein